MDKHKYKVSTREACCYYLYRQKRALLDLPYLPLVPQTTEELLRLESATDTTLHLLALPGLRLKLAEHQFLHLELVQSENSFRFEFTHSIEEMYVCLAEKFLPLEWINGYLERIYKGETHNELIMVLRKDAKGREGEDVIMCAILQSDNTISHIALKDIPEAAADDTFAFFDRIIQKNHLCYSPYFTRRVV